jgi:hypothetical protein
VKMTDFRNTLFSFEGETPAFLPARLRLPCGLTRYSNSITLEELLSCGYIGPIEVPICKPDEFPQWDAEKRIFVVCKKSPEELLIKTDQLFRLQLQELLNNCDPLERETLTEEGQSKYDNYYGKIVNLLASDTYISEQDIPSLSLNFLDKKGEKEAYLNTIIDKNYMLKMQFHYEYYGVNSWEMERPDAVMKDFKDNFTPPPTWTPSGSLSDAQIQAWKNCPTVWE